MHSQEPAALRLVWGAPARPTRGPKARFTLEQVVDAGIAVADKQGVGELSLAAVSERLGLVTTALYRYVSSKDELVELMVDRALGSPAPCDGTEWRIRAEQWTAELLARYAKHPWIVSLQPSGAPRHPNRVAWIDAILADLADGQVAAPLLVALILDSLARTFAPFAVSSAPDPLPAWLEDLIAERHPRFAGELTRDWGGLDDDFRAAVRVVIDGAAVTTAH